MMLRSWLVIGALALAQPAFAEAPLPPTSPAPVVTEIIGYESPVIRSYSGLVAAVNSVDLAFQLGGLMVERDVALGDSVLAGQPLALLDQTALAEDVAAARAMVRAAEAQAESARLAFERAAALNTRGVAATAQLEAASAAQNTSAAQVDAARAALAQAEDAQRFSALVAPEEGIITAIHAEAGSVVTAGQPVVTLAAGPAREVVIDVQTSQMPLFTPEAHFTVTAADGVTQTGGRLRLIAPVTDAAARTHRVHIALSPAVMRIGDLVSVRLDVAQAQILSVPLEAISPDGTIWRVSADRRLEEVTVTLGAQLDGRRIVTQGLAAGDEILLRGLSAARNGLPVGERIAP